MRLILPAFILLILVGNAEATTYYVRSTSTDGTQSACTGLADADYDGAGSGEACAFQYVAYALGWYGDGSTGGAAGVMVGGDTLIIKDEAVVGYTAGFSGCDTAYSYGCVTRPIPSGSAGNTTKIYGANYASCSDDLSNTTKVWGRERAQHIFNLAGNDYIDFKCLDITDKASCIYNLSTHSNNGTSSIVCNRSGSYPLGDHADYGIKSLTGTSTNITLDHVKIHGLLYGVYAQKKQDWTLNYVDLSFNSVGGWDNDLEGDGVTTPNHDEGNIAFNNVTMEYNGCGEVWDSPGTPYYCTSQTQGGYGDAQGTGGGNNANYTFTDHTSAHNVSDDIDNLYDDGTGTTMKVIRGNFQGSSGQAIKSAAETTYVENVVAIYNCGYFEGKSFTAYDAAQSGRSGSNCNNDGDCDANENSTGCRWTDADADAAVDPGEGDCAAFDHCRAQSALAFANKTGDQKWYTKNSTFYSNGDTIMTMSGANTCNAGTLVDHRNSNFIGGSQHTSGPDTADFFYSDGSGTCADGTFTGITGDYNYVVHTKNGSSDITGQANSTYHASDVSRFVGTVPLDTSWLTAADVIPNFYLTSAVGGADETVTCQGDCSVDYQNYERGASWDIGAIEYGSTPSGGGGGSSATGLNTGGIRITGAVRIQ